MSLTELATEAARVRAGPPEEWPFRAADVWRGLEAELANPEIFPSLVERLLEVAQGMKCDAVLGASRLGAQLAGGVVSQAKNGLHLLSPKSSGLNVLVLDGVLTTGTQIRSAMQLAERAGAKRVCAAVLLADREALEAWRETAVGEIVAVEEF